MKTKNTPRERVLNALNHVEPDRVPIDFGSTQNTGITTVAYENLKKHLKIDLPTVIINKSFALAEVDEPVLERFQIDTRGVMPRARDDWEDIYPSRDRYINEWGITHFQPPGLPYYDVVDGPFHKDFSKKAIKEYAWPDAFNKGRIKGIRERVRHLRAHTDYAIVLHVMGGFITQSQYLRGLQNWLEDMLAEPELLGLLIDRTLQYQMDLTMAMLEAAEYDVDVVHYGDDFGTQNGLMFSPQTYRALIKPAQAKLYDLVKKNTKAKILLHTCGSNYSIFDDLIEIGVDAYNPVQADAKDMDAARLKAQFGDRLVFWGGIDSHKVLPYGSPDDVRREVRHNIDVLAPSGGYVLNSVHNIQPDVSPENICAMFDEAVEYGVY